MSGTTYVIVAYVLGLGLLWGYGVSLWIAGRALARREQCDGGPS